MSMLATFVQVDANLLDKIRNEPSLAETLFEPAAPSSMPDLEKMRETILSKGPQLLAATAARMSPEQRRQIEARLGKTLEGLQGGEGGNMIFKMMQERFGPRSPGAVSGKHGVLSLEKAWHGLHYLLCGTAEAGYSPRGQSILGGAEVGEDFSG